MSERCQNSAFFFDRYLRMPVQEVNPLMTKSSEERMVTFLKHGPPKNKNDVIRMLGDYSNREFPVFREENMVKTIAVGTTGFS